MACYAATIIHKKLLIVVSPSISKNWAADAIGAANNGPIIGIQNTLLQPPCLCVNLLAFLYFTGNYAKVEFYVSLSRHSLSLFEKLFTKMLFSVHHVIRYTTYLNV
jgi:hypothetical protein